MRADYSRRQMRRHTQAGVSLLEAIQMSDHRRMLQEAYLSLCASLETMSLVGLEKDALLRLLARHNIEDLEEVDICLFHRTQFRGPSRRTTIWVVIAVTLGAIALARWVLLP